MDCKKKYFKKLSQDGITFPVEFFGYSLLHEIFKRKIRLREVPVKSECYNGPFASGLVNRVSPDDCIYMHWSFLKD